MGSDNSTNYMNQILYYYLFQKKIQNYLIKNNSEKESFKNETGYLIHPDLIEKWKKKGDYDNISHELKMRKIESINNPDLQKEDIKEIMNLKNIQLNEIILYTIRNAYFIDATRKIFSKEDLEIFIDEKTFDEFNINNSQLYQKIDYIIKKQMIIFYFEYEKEKKNKNINKFFISS